MKAHVGNICTSYEFKEYWLSVPSVSELEKELIKYYFD